MNICLYFDVQIPHRHKKTKPVVLHVNNVMDEGETV